MQEDNDLTRRAIGCAIERPAWTERFGARRPMNPSVPLCLCGEKFFRFQQHEPNRQTSPARIKESLTSA